MNHKEQQKFGVSQTTMAMLTFVAIMLAPLLMGAASGTLDCRPNHYWATTVPNSVVCARDTSTYPSVKCTTATAGVVCATQSCGTSCEPGASPCSYPLFSINCAGTYTRNLTCSFIKGTYTAGSCDCVP